MIKKLRYQFIAIAMCSMAAVLFLLIGGINVANYVNINRTADLRLDLLSENGGRFDGGMPPKPNTSFDRDRRRDRFAEMSAETPFETRFFTVVLKPDGTVMSVNTGQIAAVSTADASKYASALWEDGKEDGYIGFYKYRAIPVSGTLGEDNIMYIFLDCQRDLISFRSFLLISVAASLLGMLLVFLLVMYFSKRLVKPVAESYEKQKRFITDASHELKTPLTIIDANTEVLEMTTGENEWTVSIHNQIKRLSSLTQKLVFLSRMDEGNAETLTMLDFSLSDAVVETAKPFEAVAATQGKDLSLNITPNLSYCGDEASIRQLVSLLLDNAVKYSTDKGSIRLTLQANGKNKVLTVWNTAQGLTLGRQDVLFDRFYRPDASRNSATGGFGIGLSVVQAIVNAHKGKITAKSEDGESILFTVVL
ncbi:MAG: HAMP domain-containing histidine kinase [Acetatifactor sp.]|nr:HAMP domain-containing histidine kinase [Acetatifactor sp.]